MGISLYNKKRNFKSTKEPEGKVKSGSGKLKFVVQKHHASHLHYDFRLEMEGVLKSWAVPKGPSMNPDDKRLAMMVEDHPYDYKDFEGNIPEGSYGGGNVIVWDAGSYHLPEAMTRKKQEAQLLADLHNGHLHFVLEGKKLKGAFSLVKIKNGKQENAWLLVKKDDEFASKEDITLKENSVLSKLTLPKLAEKFGNDKNGISGSEKKRTVKSTSVIPAAKKQAVKKKSAPGLKK
ncbi:MAG: DNA polymerase ligase N-terminal domain-containing protein [Chitinophagales bacterium]